MLISSSALQERSVSAFPISICTALALESIMDGIQPPYDSDRPIPERINLSQYQEFWINIETLFRNIMGSVPTAVQRGLMPSEILEVMNEESDLIEELVLNNTHGQVKVVFYRNEHGNLQHTHPHAILHKVTTPRQLEYATICDQVCEQYLKMRKDKKNVVTFTRKLKSGNKPRALIMTHQAYDLLSVKEFAELDLLESHTGVLKKRSLWYTKLKNGKDLARIPVNVCTLQVFGDSNTFSPQPAALRQQVLELAEKFHWHALTTNDRLRMSFDTMSDAFAAMVLKRMLQE